MYRRLSDLRMIYLRVNSIVTTRLDYQADRRPDNLRYAAGSAYRATTPMFAMVASFVIDGTAQIYKTIPGAGARASKITFPR